MNSSLKILLGVAICGFGYVQAGTQYWANGVNEQGGWYDANKSYAVENDGDDMMCYAASASNLIAWWQDSQPIIPDGIPTKLENIWSTYKAASNSNGENGGDAGWAMAWWIGGVYSPTTSDEANRWVSSHVQLYDYSELKAHSGYYYDQCNLTCEDVSAFVGAYVNSDNYLVSSYTMSNDLVSGGLFENKTFGEIFEAGYGVSLGIANDAGSLAHAITLWGVEYDDSGNLAKMWLTDSDDSLIENGKPRLVEATVYTDNENLNRTYFTTEEVLVPVEGKPDYFYVIGYSKEEKVYIDSVHLLNPNAFSVVPEPATATLSMMVLMGLAARRRRR